MTNQMTNNKIFDLIMADALADVWDMEFAKYDDNDTAEEFQVSDEFERNIRKIRNSIGRKERMKNAGRFSLKFFVTIATIMGIAFGGLLTQPTVFAAVENVIRSVFDKSDDYLFSGSDVTVETFNSEMKFRYVPDGYSLRTGYYFPTHVRLIYSDYVEETEIIFDYSIASKGTLISVDNEHTNYKTLYYGGIEYNYYESFDSNFGSVLIWSDKGYAFSINAYLPQEELVKIAENIE